VREVRFLVWANVAGERITRVTKQAIMLFNVFSNQFRVCFKLVLVPVLRQAGQAKERNVIDLAGRLLAEEQRNFLLSRTGFLV